MGGLRRITLSEAMEILQSKNLQEYLYFKSSTNYYRVIDYEWIFNHDREVSLLNQTFYREVSLLNQTFHMELDSDIKTEEEK